MLILDEPLSGVDVEGMALLMDMLDEIRHKFDLSILMTTHDFRCWSAMQTVLCFCVSAFCVPERRRRS